MYKIGLSTRNKFFSSELFTKYRDGGMEYMEIALTSEQYEALDFDEVASLSKDNDVKIWTIHLPYSLFVRVDLSRPELAAGTVEFYGDIIRKGSAIGVERYVVHPSGEPVETDAAQRALRMDCAKKHLAALADIAECYGATIAVEDLPRSCLGRTIAEMDEILSAHTSLRICLDTNHLLTEKVPDFIRHFGDRIVTTHISDCDFVNERHWLPGEGDNDWQDIFSAFREVNYSGIWLYEVGFACPDTIVRERELECADFINNAKEIFSGRPITRLYTKKLC